ncbi:MAG: HD domain-containing protein [Mucilaginibacter sp.]|uniref:HD domain-containing protein n=1 Tax=Mucilaginibacter sp. TaxID=1882438 RepID=UPI0031A4DA4A
MMKIEDEIYGQFEVAPVLEALIKSAPVQRLKNVHQGGAIFLVDPAIKHTRYEHSLGVLYLVKFFGGGIEEQIVALLHDVSHTAFSHVADYVFEHSNEDYHETIFNEVINRSEIPVILKKYGFDTSILINEHYTILERELPDLCADRVDYTLRDLYHAKLIDKADISNFLSELSVQDGYMVVKSDKAGIWIREQFQRLNDAYFKKPEHIYANLQLAQLIKDALDKNLLQKSDLLKDDFQVLHKLEAHPYGRLRLNEIQSLTNFKQFSARGGAERFKQRTLHPSVMI